MREFPSIFLLQTRADVCRWLECIGPALGRRGLYVKVFGTLPRREARALSGHIRLPIRKLFAVAGKEQFLRYEKAKIREVTASTPFSFLRSYSFKRALYSTSNSCCNRGRESVPNLSVCRSLSPRKNPIIRESLYSRSHSHRKFRYVVYRVFWPRRFVRYTDTIYSKLCPLASCASRTEIRPSMEL